MSDTPSKGITSNRDRLIDLVRYMRTYLLDEGLITVAEFEELTLARAEEGRRLESFEAIMDRLSRKEK